MEIEIIIKEVVKDLCLVAKHNPNERLPKEEQIRSRIYATLLDCCDVVCVERNYYPIEHGSSLECDIWANRADKEEVWMEIKRCWSGASKDGWMNKPREQLKSWNEDIQKLSVINNVAEKYFVLVGMFNFDPLKHENSNRSSIINNIIGFYPDNLIHEISSDIVWRDSGMTHIGAWVWRWLDSEKINLSAHK